MQDRISDRPNFYFFEIDLFSIYAWMEFTWGFIRLIYVVSCMVKFCSLHFCPYSSQIFKRFLKFITRETFSVALI